MVNTFSSAKSVDKPNLVAALTANATIYY